ncbi:bola-like protein-domain-containing protein [Rhodotorula toruloides]
MLARQLAPRRLLSSSLVRPAHPASRMSSSAQAQDSGKSAGPVEQSIRDKLTTALSPSFLAISNDSHLHRHHAPMKAIGGGGGETHFTVQVVSDKFEGLRQIQRHRLVNETLKSEFDAGLHALSIKAKSPTEYNKEQGTA